MTRTEFKRMARAAGYTHIDPGQWFVVAYNPRGGELHWYEDTVKPAPIKSRKRNINK